MELNLTKHKVRCDFAGCNNFAKYSFKTKGLLKGEMFFCEKCAKDMFDAFAKEFVPKGVEAPFKNRKQIRRRNEN